MWVYLSDGSVQTSLRAATLTKKLQIKLSTSPSHSILTPGQPVPVLTLECQVPYRADTGVPIFKSLVWLDPGKSHRKWDSNTGSSALEADTLTTRPTRQHSTDTLNDVQSKRTVKWLPYCLWCYPSRCPRTRDGSWSHPGRSCQIVYLHCRSTVEPDLLLQLKHHLRLWGTQSVSANPTHMQHYIKPHTWLA